MENWELGLVENTLMIARKTFHLTIQTTTRYYIRRGFPFRLKN